MNEPDNQLPPSWPESGRFVPRTFVQPVLRFMRYEAAGGLFMLVAAIVAIIWANSPFGHTYFDFFGAKIEIALGNFHFHHLSDLTVGEWVNDALMVIFFFVVGLEIKRELVIGELRDPRAAALPAIAAIGGMILPALIYMAFNAGTDAARGWAIPMATDIAFAVGVVSMVGRRVPIGAKLFLLALAIVDDLGAILVIALFYTDQLFFGWLGAAVLGLAVTYIMGRAGIRSFLPYLFVGIFVWLAVLESGVHATIAGVALAFLTPVRPYFDPRRFEERAGTLVRRVGEYMPSDRPLFHADHRTIERVSAMLSDLKRLSQETISPLDRLEQMLSPWASYVIVPAFALANAGVVISGDSIGGLLTQPLSLGVAVGLVAGKTIGVVGAAFVAVKLGLGRLPAAATWHHMIGIGMLAGIGFTVALFVSALAFTDPVLGDAAKIGIFSGSLVAGLTGFLWLRLSGPELPPSAQETGPVVEVDRAARA